MRRLVWSEVRDLLSIAAVDSVDDLIFVLEEYRADPPLPDEEIDLRAAARVHENPRSRYTYGRLRRSVEALYLPVVTEEHASHSGVDAFVCRTSPIP